MSDTTHLYLNVSVVNPITATAAIPAAISQQFSEDFLTNASDFDGSFVRLALPTDAIPYFDGATAGPFYVTLTWRNVDYKQQVQIVGWGATSSDLHIYYIQQFLDSVNTALSTAYSAVAAANPTDYNLYPGHAPYIQWSQTTQLFTLVTDVNTWEISSGFNAGIYFNTPLSALFGNLPQTLVAYNSGSGKDSELRIANRGYNLVAPTNATVYVAQLTAGVTWNTTVTSLTVSMTVSYGLPSGAQVFFLGNASSSNQMVFQSQIAIGGLYNLSSAVAPGATSFAVTSKTAPCSGGGSTPVYLVSPQQILTVDETPSCLNWCQLTRIIVKSKGNFPVRMELAPASTSGPSTELKSEQIITDYIMDPQTRLNGQQILLMIPTPQYRWFDLKDEGKLRATDFQFYAANFDGSKQVPIMLTPGNGFNSKVLFDRKTVSATHLSTEERLKNCGGGAAALEALDRLKRQKISYR